MLQTGIKGRQEMIVRQQDTAAAMGSGQLQVFATPAMIALAEKTAWMSVAPFLEDGQGTVGTSMNVQHISATPVGMKVWCESELTSIDRRKLTFKLEIFDEAGKIGEGEHERFIIMNDRFFEKAQSKLAINE